MPWPRGEFALRGVEGAPFQVPDRSSSFRVLLGKTWRLRQGDCGGAKAQGPFESDGREQSPTNSNRCNEPGLVSQGLFGGKLPPEPCRIRRMRLSGSRSWCTATTLEHSARKRGPQRAATSTLHESEDNLVGKPFTCFPPSINRLQHAGARAANVPTETTFSCWDSLKKLPTLFNDVDQPRAALIVSSDAESLLKQSPSDFFRHESDRDTINCRSSLRIPNNSADQ